MGVEVHRDNFSCSQARSCHQLVWNQRMSEMVGLDNAGQPAKISYLEKPHEISKLQSVLIGNLRLVCMSMSPYSWKRHENKPPTFDWIKWTNWIGRGFDGGTL